MRNWFTRRPTPSSGADNVHTAVTHRDGWFSPEPAEKLLSTPPRKHLLHTLWQRTSLPRPLFDELYQQPIYRYAGLVQQLPASENHHHACPGGLLDHTLEVMAFAAQMRQSHLLPVGAAPEDQAREAEAWTAAVIYAALLHDVGKIVTDMEIETDNHQRWYPWEGALTRPYRLKFRHSRDYQLHPATGSLLCLTILPATALTWLAQYPALLSALLYCISGHYDKAGLPGELVQNADRASVAQNMGGDPGHVLARPRTSLSGQITTAIRELARSQLTLNNTTAGSDGWFTGEALWLVSKTTADRIRAWLLQNGITGIPDSNSRLFDEMQGYGLIVAAPDNKAIWHCTITAHAGWTPGSPLTLLRFSPEVVWPDIDARPAIFEGTITPVTLPLSQDETAIFATKTTTPPENIPSDLNELAFSLFEPSEQLPPTASATTTHLPEGIVKTPNTTPIITTPPIAKGISTARQALSANGFVDWLRKGIAEHRLVVNDVLARIHMVDGAALLVSPGIFILYVKSTTGQTGDEWRQLQKDFQRLQLHRRSEDGVNIWNIEVRGPRRTRRVKGYLINNPAEIFGQSVPEDNPYLSIIT
ncbi:MobH family relaxase [Citrobacter portucalensis]|uniref:MobH family relaxase n=1 Tax=Citrobacter portucalensis TaxID=1639133 RepID=UPI00226B5EE9|nr:MobH family relaxase [Citrobacter portucalensis]MCX8984234.1 TraI domain-containing protein [Citrobacter portucalensis]